MPTLQTILWIALVLFVTGVVVWAIWSLCVLASEYVREDEERQKRDDENSKPFIY